MFYPRRSSNVINKVQKTALRITYNDQLTDLKSLLSNHNEITIHQRNLQVLMTEIYKIINHIALPITSYLFEIRKNTHNTRYFQVRSNESRRTISYGLETICLDSTFPLGKSTTRIQTCKFLKYFQKKNKKLERRKLSM